jgi:CDP-paratose 2-epimerase
MKLLITGGCGFLGSNLAAEAIRRGHDIYILDNLSRIGSESNHYWLKQIGAFSWQHGDVRNQGDVSRAIKVFQPEMIFHLAGQVAMTTSLASPRLDFEINALGTINILEAVREHVPTCGVVYSSTNKVYGDLEEFRYEENPQRYTCLDRPDGFDERTPFNSHSPYGCSKGCADLYMIDYARMFGLNSVVFRHSSMYGGRQFSTVDQGWIGWFCEQALRIKRGEIDKVKIAGNGKQVRDVLHAEDMVSLYFRAAERIQTVRGHAFNVGGGMRNSLSLRELFCLLGEFLDVDVLFESTPNRESDQKVFVADIKKAEQLLGWRPQVDAREGIKSMLEWCNSLMDKA